MSGVRDNAGRGGALAPVGISCAIKRGTKEAAIRLVEGIQTFYSWAKHGLLEYNAPGHLYWSLMDQQLALNSNTLASLLAEHAGIDGWRNLMVKFPDSVQSGVTFPGVDSGIREKSIHHELRQFVVAALDNNYRPLKKGGTYNRMGRWLRHYGGTYNKARMEYFKK